MRKQTRPASARPSPFAPPKRRCSGGGSSTAEARKAQGKHRTPLDGIMLRRHCRGPDRASLGPLGATVSNGSWAHRDAPGRHRRAHRHRLQKPLRGAFFAVRQNRTTLLFLSCINGRLIPVRVFVGHLLQPPRRRSSPTSGREACSASISSRAKTTAGLGRKKSPEAGVFEAKYAPCAAAVRRFRRLLQGIVQTPSGS